MKKLVNAIILVAVLTLQGCAVYSPAYRYPPGYYGGAPYYGYPGYVVGPPVYGFRFGYGHGWYGHGWRGYGWRHR